MSLLNTHLGNYKVVAHIADGKDATIYLAMHEHSGLAVAIKALRLENARNRSRIAQLVNESSVLKRLDHPNIVRFFKLERRNFPPYIVIEYFRSKNLKQRIIQRDEMIMKRAMRIIMQMCSALEHLHDCGIIHKDIKSENILVSNGGDVRLIDFAIAEKLRFRLCRALARRTTRIQGTRTYIAPEQIKGGQLDVRTDIYSLGITIYEMLVGRPPFVAADSNMLLYHHLNTPPEPMRKQNEKISEEFDAIVMRMLGKKPEQRPQSITKLMEALGQVRVFKNARVDTRCDG